MSSSPFSVQAQLFTHDQIPRMDNDARELTLLDHLNSKTADSWQGEWEIAGGVFVDQSLKKIRCNLMHVAWREWGSIFINKMVALTSILGWHTGAQQQ